VRNFFLKTLYQKRYAALWWFVGITAVTLLTVSFYHSFKATDLDQVLKGLPQPIQAIAGDISSFRSVEGYLRQQVFALRLPLLTIILAISLLVGLTAGDEQKGLLETQLSLPISRTQLLLQKLAAGLIVMGIASLGALVGIAIGVTLLGETFNLGHILQYTLNCVMIATVYGLVGLTIAAITGRRAVALGISSGFAFLSYLLNSMAPSVSYLETIDKFTFFHYYQNYPFQLRNFAVLAITAIILVTISCIAFNKRDIRSN
jgi:ABC-2 type transport system permease protein